MDKVSLINRITKTKTSDVIHSSGYAQAQNAGNMGAGSTQSFAQRQAIEKQRQHIQGYKNSHLGANVVNHHLRDDASESNFTLNHNNLDAGTDTSINATSTPSHLPQSNRTANSTNFTHRPSNNQTAESNTARHNFTDAKARQPIANARPVSSPASRLTPNFRPDIKPKF